MLTRGDSGECRVVLKNDVVPVFFEKRDGFRVAVGRRLEEKRAPPNRRVGHLCMYTVHPRECKLCEWEGGCAGGVRARARVCVCVYGSACR